MNSIFDFSGDKVVENDHWFELSVPLDVKKRKKFLFITKPSDESNYKELLLEIGKVKFVMYPSLIGISPSVENSNVFFKYDVPGDKFLIECQEGKIRLHKNDFCIHEIVIKQYPTVIKIRGGKMIMERLRVK